MGRTARSITDRLFDRLASGKQRGIFIAALAAPAVAATGLVVTVHSGDTLSGIAARECGGHANDWTGIYAANKAVIGSNPNLIKPGQQLDIKCDDPPQLLRLGSSTSSPSTPAATGSGSYGHPDYCGDGDGDGWDIACPVQGNAGSAGSSRAPAPAGPASVTTAGMGSFQACVISRESGGNPDIWNPSGHYGLYQFSAGTWAAYGGAPGDFGHASAAEQTQVFDNAMAAGGESNWAPYDGC
jgi:hypothetical protein